MWLIKSMAIMTGCGPAAAPVGPVTVPTRADSRSLQCRVVWIMITAYRAL